MFIKSLQVENSRCLKSLRLGLGPLNVLIGPNAAGKSTILDVFAFLDEFLSVRDPVGRRGGYRDLAWDFDVSRRIAIALDVRRVLVGSKAP